jgi:putative aldouronate transport system substrate-binding protein
VTPPLNRRSFLTGALGAGSVALLGSTLTGCGSSAGDGLALGRPVRRNPTLGRTSGVYYKKGYVGPIASGKGRITTGPAELRVLVMQNATVGDWHTNKFTKWYEERTGVKVHFDVIASEDSKTKINAMIASGDIPDVFMGAGFTASQLMYYGDQGLFLRLNDLIGKYGTETRRVFRDIPESKELATAPDGSIYAVPGINDCFHCKAWEPKMWVYQPWLDKLGLELPDTPDAFEEMLKAFKTGDPNGDGKKDEIIPFAANKDMPIEPFFMAPYLYTPPAPWLYLEDGKVTSATDQEGWREGLRFLHRLGKQGLINPGTFTQDGEALNRIGANKARPLLGSSMAGYYGGIVGALDLVDPKARWRNFTTVPVLKDADGKRTSSWLHYQGVILGNFVITKACRNPEIALMWGDGLMELEAVCRQNLGALGTNWEWGGKGRKGINGKQALWERNPKKLPQPGEYWDQAGLMYRSNDFRLGQYADPKNPDFEKPLYEETKESYYKWRVERERVMPPQYMTADQVGESGEIQVTMQNYVKQSIAKFTLGELDPNKDGDWKAYLSKLHSIGLKRFLTIQQAAYDAKYGS